MQTFCRITMQPPLFELKLKTFPLLHQLIRWKSRLQQSLKEVLETWYFRFQIYTEQKPLHISQFNCG